MTIEERKERILEITRTIINHELAITQLKDEMDDLISLMDGRKRRTAKKIKISNSVIGVGPWDATRKQDADTQEEDKPEPFVPELPTEPNGL